MSEESFTLKLLKERFPDKIIEIYSYRDDDTTIVQKDAIVEIMRFLKEDERLKYNFLMDLAGVDYLAYKKEPRFEVVYHLYSLEYNRRVRIKAPVDEDDPEVDSLTRLWKAANWYEREVWDMYGIKFKGHPNLKRLLMYEEFVGHPLRKDYPINKRQPLIGPKN
jgi:NADH-quinone oxidoreductase subunit C